MVAAVTVRAPLDADAHRVFVSLRERLRGGGRFALIQSGSTGEYELRRTAPVLKHNHLLGWVDGTTSVDDIKALMAGRKPARSTP